MSKMSKSEVYSWRLTPALKAELEAVARDEKSTVGAVLERVVGQWLKRRRKRGADDAEQKRMRAALMACAGMYKGDGTSATNARVREVMGEYLEAKYARRRTR